MSADDEEPEVADAADAPSDAPLVRQPPGPADRPFTNLPPPPSAGEQADAVDEAIEALRLEAGLAPLGAPPDPEVELPPAEAVPAPTEPVDRADADADADADAEDEVEDEAPTDVAEVLHDEWDREDEAFDEPDLPPELDDLELAERAGPAVEPEVRPEEPELEPEPELASELEPALEPDLESDLESEPEPAPEPEPVEPPVALLEGAAPRVARPVRRRRRPRLVIGALVLAVVSTVVAVAKTREANDLVTDRDDRRAIEAVASRFGAAYLSYDFAHVEESGRAVTQLATEAFGRSYAAERAPGIQELFTSGQTTTKASTTEVFVGSVTSRTARALVVVDVTATSPTDGEQHLEDVSFVLDLTRTRAGWRVAQVARAPSPSVEGAASP